MNDSLKWSKEAPGMIRPTSKISTPIAFKAVLLAAWLTGSSACQMQSRTATPTPSGVEALDHGVFRPMSIRIHPLTREVRPDTQDAIVQTIELDVHVELFDAWGHPTKALGTLQFELVQGSRTGLHASGSLEENVSRATINMLDPEINSVKYYDSATRTYRMYLEAPRRFSNAPITLTAVYISPGGRRLEDRYTIDRRTAPTNSAPAQDETNTEPASTHDDGQQSRSEG
jgi:hypothetical protein